MKGKSKKKRRILSLLLAAVLCISMIPFSSIVQSSAESADTLNYVALGDSITTGYNLGADETGFVTLLGTEIGADATVNSGADGLTTTTLLAALSDLDTSSTEYAAIAAADVITITIGGNDMMMSFYGFIADLYNQAYSTDLTAETVKGYFSDMDTYGTEVTVMLGIISAQDYSDELKASSSFQSEVASYVSNVCSIVNEIEKISDAVIIVANQYNPYQWMTGYTNIVNLFDAGVSYYNEKLSEEPPCMVANVYSAFAESTSTLTNASVYPLNLDFHPNAEGHAVIADVMESAYDYAADIYTYEIPVTLTVAEGGSADASEQTFELEVLDYNKKPMDIESLGGKVIYNTVETEGAGTYTATLKFKVSEDVASYDLSDGCAVSLASGTVDGWTYDATVYWVYVGFDGTQAYEMDIYDYDDSHGTTFDTAEFTCTYTGYTLTFDTTGGGALSSVSAATGTVISLSGYTPTYSGYEFAGWYSDSKLNTSVTSVTLTADTTVYAGWTAAVIVPTTYTVTASAGSNGSVSPASQTVEEGSDAAVTITPDSGYEIDTVLLDDTDVTSDVASDGTYTIGNVQAAHSISVTFKESNVQTSYVVTASAGNNGSVSPVSQTVEEGADATITITPDSGYEIDTVLLDDADVTSDVASDNTYTIENVQAAHSISVTFKESNVPTTYTVTASAGSNGSVTPESQTVEEGADATITITPDSGYEIDTVLLDGTDVTSDVGSDNTYTIENVQVAHSISVIFKESNVQTSYTVTASAGTNGSISPASQTVEEGADATITITPDSGYEIDTVLLDGTDVTSAVASDNTYTIENVQAAHSISVTFKESYVQMYYTVTASAGSNGSVTPLSQTVEEGADATITITPDSGYEIDTVLLDGTDVTADIAGDNTYTIENVQAVHSISVTFKESYVQMYYTVTASAGSNGSITPLSQTVEEGADATITITPDSGYEIETVLLDGTDVTSEVASDNTYTIANVQAAHSISVTFKKSYVQPSYLAVGDNITYGDGLTDAENECFVTLFADAIDASDTVTETQEDLTAADLASIIQLLPYVGASSSYYQEIAAADVITLTIGQNDLMTALYAFAAELYNDAYGTSLDADNIEELIFNSGSSVSLLVQANQLLTLLNNEDHRAALESSDDFQTAVAAIVTNVNTIVSTIKTINPDAVVLVANQYNPYQWLSYCDNISSLFDTGATYFNKILSENNSAGYTIADVYTAFAASGDSLTNASVNFTAGQFDFYFIPNAAGHKVIAQVMQTAYAAVTAEYKWEIPVELEVQEDGSGESPAKTFTLEILDPETGDVMDVSSSEIGGTTVSNTVNTNTGEGTYSATLCFTGDYGLYQLLNDGFYVRLASGSADSWTYDDTTYYVNVFFEGGEAYKTVIYEADDYENSNEPTSLDAAAFACTYTGWTLSFVTNEGSAVDSVTAAEGTELSLSEYVTVRVGYVFSGWFSDSALETSVTEMTLNGDTTVYAGWDEDEIYLQSDETDTYLALGDSVTLGYGLSQASTEGCVNLFSGAINATNTLNRSAYGTTSDQLLANMEADGYDDDIAEANVITVTVSTEDVIDAICDEIADIYNTNNTTGSYLTGSGVKSMLTGSGSGSEIETYSLLQTYSDTGSGDFGDAYDLLVMLNTQDFSPQIAASGTYIDAVNTSVANINSIAAKIKEINQDAVILVTNQYNPYQWQTGCDNIVKLFETGFAAYNDALAAAATTDYTIVDVSTVFASYQVSLSNANIDLYSLDFDFDYHPNATGHQVIASMMLVTYAATTNICTWEVPVEMTVASAGSVGAPEQTFELELLDMNGTVIDPEEFGITIVLNTVDTDGAGTYTATLEFTGNEYVLQELSNGFYIQLADSGSDGWSSDEAVYYVKVSFDEKDQMTEREIQKVEVSTYNTVDTLTNAANAPTELSVLSNSSLSYAVFTCTYTGWTLTFETNGGTTISSVEAADGTTISLSEYTPTRSGYTFTGWYADSTLATQVTDVTLSGDVTIYAGWEENTSGTTQEPSNQGSGTTGSTDTGTSGGTSTSDATDTGTSGGTSTSDATDTGTSGGTSTSDAADTGTSGQTSTSDTADAGTSGETTVSDTATTGDDSHMGVWIILVLLGGVVVLRSVTGRRKRTM